jgi:hypothetical protein
MTTTMASSWNGSQRVAIQGGLLAAAAVERFMICRDAGPGLVKHIVTVRKVTR